MNIADKVLGSRDGSYAKHTVCVVYLWENFQPQTHIFHNRISLVSIMDILYQELLLLLLSNSYLKKLVSGSPYRLDNGIDPNARKSELRLCQVALL